MEENVVKSTYGGTRLKINFRKDELILFQNQTSKKNHQTRGKNFFRNMTGCKTFNSKLFFSTNGVKRTKQ